MKLENPIYIGIEFHGPKLSAFLLLVLFSIRASTISISQLLCPRCMVSNQAAKTIRSVAPAELVES
jgi:hypothetical protein